MEDYEKQRIAEQMYEMECLGVVDTETSEELQAHYGGWLAEIFEM